MSSRSALGTLGGRLSHHTALYGSGAVIGFALGIVNVAVLTRLLDLGEFADLALLLFFAALLTFVYNIGTLQGTFMRVFGSSGEEDIDEEQDEATAGKKRQALGSALALTVLIGAVGTAAIVPFAEPVADVLTGTEDLAEAVRLAAVSGALGAVWRLVVNVMRYERRPVAFVGLSAVRPVLVLAISIPLVSNGGGVEGAVAGVAIGTALAVAVALAATRRSYAPALRWEDVRDIVRRGMVFVPIILAFWVVHNVDLYLVSAYATDRDVALFRVASRIAAGVSYFVSAFLMAWTPLRRTSLHKAVEDEHGISEATAVLLRWFAFASLWIMLGLTVLADVLIRVAPSSYSDAAPLIPVIGFGFVAYGAFVVIYRGARMPDKRRAYVRLAIAAAVLFVLLGIALVPPLGGYGAAIAQIVAFTIVTIVLIGAVARAGNPLPLDAGRLLRALAATAVLLGAGVAAGELLGEWRLAVDVVALLLFPFVLMWAGALPRAEVEGLLGRVRVRPAALRPQRGATRRLGELWLDERLALELLFGRGEPLTTVAREMNSDEETVLREVVAALRRAAGAGPPSPDDVQLGEYLLTDDAVAERDVLARRLWAGDLEPLDIDAVEQLVSRLRQASRRDWAAAFPVPTRTPDSMARILRDLWLDERLALEMLFGRREAVTAVAREMSIDEDTVLRVAVAALRRAAGAGPPSPADVQLGVYLLVDAVAERAALARRLWSSGLEPLDIAAVEQLADRLRQASARDWEAAFGLPRRAPDPVVDPVAPDPVAPDPV